ncbi:MAG TPA: hypothetical protein VII92_15960 [Anaerolineae bacterium]
MTDYIHEESETDRIVDEQRPITQEEIDAAIKRVIVGVGSRDLTMKYVESMKRAERVPDVRQ